MSIDVPQLVLVSHALVLPCSIPMKTKGPKTPLLEKTGELTWSLLKPTLTRTLTEGEVGFLSPPPSIQMVNSTHTIDYISGALQMWALHLVTTKFQRCLVVIYIYIYINKVDKIFYQSRNILPTLLSEAHHAQRQPFFLLSPFSFFLFPFQLLISLSYTNALRNRINCLIYTQKFSIR